MKEKDKFKLIVIILLIYLIWFLIYTFITKNMEYFYYAIFHFVIIIFVLIYHKKLHIHLPILIGLGIFELLHSLGGIVFINGQLLYDTYFGFIRYDNIVHGFASLVMLLLAYNLLKPHLDHTIKYKPTYLLVLLVLITLGIGASVEIVEFGAVVFFEHQTVGDYFDNAFDLVVDTIGAIIGFFFVHSYHKKKIKKIKKVKNKSKNW